MKVAAPAQMREIDRLAIEEYGIPGIVLMENASLRVTEEIDKLLGGCKGKTVSVFAGKGNNGGDAFAVARQLSSRGAAVRVYTLFDNEDLKSDAGVNHAIIGKLGIYEQRLHEDGLPDDMCSADILVDGIFGTGFRGEVSGLACIVIEKINSSGKPVLSIDIPSGLDGCTGRTGGICVKAGSTVTFGLPKLGMVIQPGCEFCGRILVADIGLPAAAIERAGIRVQLIDDEMAAGIIPKRSNDSNKGDYGKILLITGSKGMTGSGCLSAEAALRTGAGLVYLAVPTTLADIYDLAVTEAVVSPLEDDGSGHFSPLAAESIPQMLKGKNAAAIGPGLSLKQGARKIVKTVLESSEIPLVLDADALNAVSGDLSMLKALKAPAVITPHPGEMSRLMGKTIKEVQSDRIAAAVEFSEKWGVVTVLKGFRTVVAFPDGRVFINPTGNSGMATGGAGDVLTGIIAALMGQGADPGFSAVAGVYIHGLAGDCASEEKGEHGLIASDIIEKIPHIIKRLVGRDKG